MNEDRFQMLLGLASLFEGPYAEGYRRGLRRHYFGERFGTSDEHRKWLELGKHSGDASRVNLGRGYRDGYAGDQPTFSEEDKPTS